MSGKKRKQEKKNRQLSEGKNRWWNKQWTWTSAKNGFKDNLELLPIIRLLSNVLTVQLWGIQWYTCIVVLFWFLFKENILNHNIHLNLLSDQFRFVYQLY